jgi:hypothetical protein
VLRGIFGPQTEEVAGHCIMRSFIIRVIKSWRRWAGYVAHTGRDENAYNILVGKN